MTDMSASGVRPGPRPDGSASAVGALWVAGLGAFLLVVAAATFVTMRWDDIPEGAKFAALVAVTFVCLVLHRALRGSFPLTASAIFHLGVLLVPIDVAAIGVRLEWEWPDMLLAQGLAAAVTFGIGALVEDSVVLRWASWGAVVALAGGIGATTGIPAGLLVAGAALAATNVRHPRADLAAVGWAALAGLAVPLAGARDLDLAGVGVLSDLGLTAARPAPVALVTGLLAGVALGRLGARRSSVPLALAGIACALDGIAIAWATWGPADTDAPLDLAAAEAAVAAGILLAELAAWIWSRDAFWCRPTAIVAGVGEAVAYVMTLGLGFLLLAAPFDVEPLPATGLAGGLLTLAWLAAVARNPAPSPSARPTGPGREVVSLDGSVYVVALWTLGPILAAVAASGAVMAATGSGTAAAVAMAIGGVAVLAAAATVLPDPRMVSGLLAVALLGWAPVAGYEVSGLAGGLAAAGGLAVAAAAVATSRRFPVVWTTGPVTTAGVLALVPLVVGGFVLVGDGQELAGALLVVVGAWAAAAVLDLARVDEQTVARLHAALPWVPARGAVVTALVFTVVLTPEQAVGVAVLAGLLLLADAVRRNEPLLLVGTGIAVPVALTATALAVDRTLPAAGLALCFVSLAWLGLSGVLPARWAPPSLLAAAISAGWGLVLAADDPAALATGSIVVGVAVACIGLVVGEHQLSLAGAAAAVVGYWGHLGLADVEADEAYVMPLAACLLVAGMIARRDQGASSWAAHTPAVLLLGGAALFERLDEGAGWHGLVAGAVGLVAVVVGGNWRLAGPLLTGTALLVALSVHETLGVTSQFPNWVWFALAGTALLSAGLVMERRGLGPVESGRRLLDVVHQRFT